MKIWKALGIAALAAIVPVRFKKDEDTGVKTFQSLLWKLDVGPKDGNNVEIGLDLMEGVLTGPLMDVIASRQEEADLFTDDPAEAAVDPELAQVIADDAQAAADEAQAIADDLQSAADDAQALADDLQTAADEAQAEADADDFDPEF